MWLYWQIAIKYLRYNIRRTVVTLVGIIISASFMFGVVNTLFCKLNDERRETRLEDGYEAIFFDVSEEQLEKMVQDYNVAKYEIKNYQEPIIASDEKPVIHEDAGWVRFKNPYFMRMDYKKICKEMGLEGELNGTLAELYDMQGDGDALAVFVGYGLLACYLTGGFAVLVTKNTLRLSIMEKIRDYGVLRCIGTSLKQLRKIVVKEAVIMAVPAAFVGSILGYLIMKSTVELLALNITVIFCFEAFIVTLVALLCSMYFSAIDPCNMVKGITPVMAMNRQLKLPEKERKLSEKQRLAREKKHEKMLEKRRRKAEESWLKGKNGFSLYGHLFGIEGEYAYKSMRRNRRRYYGTLFAFSASVIVFIVLIVLGMAFKDYKEFMLNSNTNTTYNITISSDEPYGISHGYGDLDTAYDAIDDATMAQLKKEKAVLDCKELRLAKMFVSNSKTAQDIYTEEFLTKSVLGRDIDEMDKESSMDMYLDTVAGFQMAIIEEDDVSDYEKDVLEGTVRPEELSDNGIVLVNEGIFYDYDDDYDLGVGQQRKLTITKYQIGDTISFYDLAALQEEMQKEMAKCIKKLKASEENKNISDEEIKKLACWYSVNDAEKNVLKKGKIKEYVVEGILSRDRSGHVPDSFAGMENGRLILTKESTFYDMTGMDRETIQGYRLKLDTEASVPDVNRISNLLYSMQGYNEDTANETGPAIGWSGLEQISLMYSMRTVELVLIAVVVILFSISCINILNNNASSIFLRKSELAQMRVIGMSKKRLVKMLALEGCIMAAAATIIGSIIGIAISYGLICMLKVMILEVTYRFPLFAIIVVFVVTIAIMIISTVIPVAGLHNDLVEDMAVEE